jgi:hypothetical protein
MVAFGSPPATEAYSRLRVIATRTALATLLDDRGKSSATDRELRDAEGEFELWANSFQQRVHEDLG